MTTCTTCAHWNPKRSGAMAKHHFAICDKGKAWVFNSPAHCCTKHQPAPEAITAARVAWLNKKR